ncbi:MAG: hypothetical protein JSS22_04150 [Proteobacteria bacterium]|nr:hypothetical protein [Pseudomonadota bacterium]
MVAERRQLLDAAMTSLGQAAAPDPRSNRAGRADLRRHAAPHAGKLCHAPPHLVGLAAQIGGTLIGRHSLTGHGSADGEATMNLVQLESETLEILRRCRHGIREATMQKKKVDIDFVARAVLILVNGVTPAMSAQARAAAEALAKESGIKIPQQ